MAAPLQPPHGVVAPLGEFDLLCCQQLLERLKDVVDAGCNDLILDVSSIDFVDASALGSLDRLRRAFDRARWPSAARERADAVRHGRRLSGYEDLLPAVRGTTSS